MSKHYDTDRVDAAHQEVVTAVRSFQLDTATPGTLDTLRERADAVAVAIDMLSEAVDEAEDNDAPDIYSGWSTLPATV